MLPPSKLGELSDWSAPSFTEATPYPRFNPATGQIEGIARSFATIAELDAEAAARVSVDTQLNTALAGKASKDRIERDVGYVQVASDGAVTASGGGETQIALGPLIGAVLRYNAGNYVGVGNGAIYCYAGGALAWRYFDSALETARQRVFNDAPGQPCGIDQGAPNQSAPLREFWGITSTGQARRMGSLTARFRNPGNSESFRATELVLETANDDGTLAQRTVIWGDAGGSTYVRSGGNDFRLLDASGNPLLRGTYTGAWSDDKPAAFFQLGPAGESGIFTGLGGSVFQRFGISAQTTHIFDAPYYAAPVPAPSAVAQFDSTERGLLPPRLTTAQRDAIASPAEGLLIYNTTQHKLNVRGASTWEALASA